MQRKAFLAIAFAVGVLNWQLPVCPQDKIESADLLIDDIANNTQTTAEIRAFYLLKLAAAYLGGTDSASAEKQFRPLANEPITKSRFRASKNWNDILVSWANQVSAGSLTDLSVNAQAGSMVESKPISKEKVVLATSAIQKALTQLDQTSNKFARLKMYFIASRLLQEIGNTAGVQKCDEVLEEAFKDCENSSRLDEEAIKASSSVLNSMAYGLLPIRVPERKPTGVITRVPVPFYTKTEFDESEKLRLRALAMTDRLASNNHLRWRAHRDMALWYVELGNLELGENQKQILFQLVGRSDDSILYPQETGCGVLLWFPAKSGFVRFLCGMG